MPNVLQQFGESIPKNYPMEVVSKAFFEKNWRVILGLGLREARVHIAGENHKTMGPCLRIDLNPRKLGLTGANELLGLLGHNGFFHPSEMLAVAKVTRLDVAVDVVGIHMREVIVRHAKQGVRSMYIGPDGELETLYVHRKKPPLKLKIDDEGLTLKTIPSRKPAGDVLVAIYDRVKERAARGKLPPFGDAPVTRIEVVRRRFQKQLLPGLPDLADVLKDTWVGFARSQISAWDPDWDRYRTFRLTMPHGRAVQMAGVQVLAGTDYGDAFEVVNPDLVSPAINWKLWDEGLIKTGLMSLIKAASPPQ